MFNRSQSLNAGTAINIVNEPLLRKDGLTLALQQLTPNMKNTERPGAVQESHSAPISCDKTGPIFKGEHRLNIDSALGIYTQGLGAPNL